MNDIDVPGFVPVWQLGEVVLLLERQGVHARVQEHASTSMNDKPERPIAEGIGE
jgi:hypothetical protein